MEVIASRLEAMASSDKKLVVRRVSWMGIGVVAATRELSSYLPGQRQLCLEVQQGKPPHPFRLQAKHWLPQGIEGPVSIRFHGVNSHQSLNSPSCPPPKTQ